MDNPKRKPLVRAMWLLNELLTGAELSVAEAAEVMGVNVARARLILETVRAEFEPAQQGSMSKASIRVAGIRYGEPSHEVAIAACLGAALASLFEGTTLQTGMRDALEYVTSASTNAGKFRDLERKFFFVRRGGEMALPRESRMLERIAKAVLDQRPLRVTYRDFHGKPRNETIEPLSIGIYDHQIYVLARRRRNAEYRTYRFSRFLEARRTGGTFEYPPPHEFDPGGLFHHSFGVIMGVKDAPTTVVVRLSEKWIHYAQHHRWHWSQGSKLVEGGIEVTMHVRICEEVRAWILSFGPDAEVLEPRHLREEIATLARGLADVYAR